MKILALEPYYGGSHKAFIDGCAKHSKHDWTILTLPPHKWKWRMRHSAVTFAGQSNKLVQDGLNYDLLFCTDMLPLAEFKGLVGKSIANIPSVIYFHENQLTYPVQVEKERDLHFPISNFISMLAADQIWFNSSFHKESFFSACKKMLKRMPDDQMLDQLSLAEQKSILFPQAINPNPHKRNKFKAPVHIGWVARWEFDKNPKMFFSVLEKLKAKNIPFKLSVIGEQFKNSPEIFNKVKELFKEEIINFGYLDSFDQYQKALSSIDILVSTADHEFFGISVMEAIDSGAFPILPHKLSYPELLSLKDNPDNNIYFYDGSEKDLQNKLFELVKKFNNGTVSFNLQYIANQYYWNVIGGKLDSSLEKLV